MIVVDTSAVLAALTSGADAERLRSRMSADGDLHAPHLIDVEVLHALRRLVAQRVLTADRALAVRADFAHLIVTRYPHHPFADRIWELRNSISAYDATFVALSEALGAALVTCDARLAATGGHRAPVELFAAR